MTRPELTPYSPINDITLQPRERYLPTAFDDSLTLLEKVNKVIYYINSISESTNGVISKWNEVMEWLLNEGLETAVASKLQLMFNNGDFDSIINEEILNSKSTIILSDNEPTGITLDSSVFWYEIINN